MYKIKKIVGLSIEKHAYINQKNAITQDKILQISYSMQILSTFLFCLRLTNVLITTSHVSKHTNKTCTMWVYNVSVQWVYNGCTMGGLKL